MLDFRSHDATNVFPEGTIMFKELQLTKKPEENSDGSRAEPSGRGYFPGAFNGADVTIKVSRQKSIPARSSSLATSVHRR
jgi:hypothetical protein